MRDKDIENRIRVISEVMSMGAEKGERQLGAFVLPANMAVSIYQTLVNIVTNASICPVSKDFLIKQVLECLEKLTRDPKIL